MGKNERIILWIMVIVALLFNIYNVINISYNHRTVDILDERQEFLGDALYEVVITQGNIARTQRVILEMIDELIIKEAK